MVNKTDSDKFEVPLRHPSGWRSRQLDVHKFELQGENPKMEIEIWMVFKALGVLRPLKE